jgi:hypothetical protein
LLRLSVINPCYNERETVEELFRRVRDTGRANEISVDRAAKAQDCEPSRRQQKQPAFLYVLVFVWVAFVYGAYYSRFLSLFLSVVSKLVKKLLA